jgi:hypothetical protein
MNESGWQTSGISLLSQTQHSTRRREEMKKLFSVGLLAGMALLLAQPDLYAASLTHDYQLNGSLADSLGGPSLVANGGTLNPTNYSFGANQGLSLSNGFTNTADYSIATTFNLANLSGYGRLIDFQNRTSDTGLYNLNTALNFYNITTGAAGAFSPNVDALLVVTRNAGTNAFVGYVNGIQQISFTDSSSLAVFSAPNNIAHFFIDDLVVPNEASAGVVDRIRIYNGALTAAEVAALSTGGTGGTTVPEPAGLLLLGSGLAGLAAWRMKRAS